MTHVVCIARVPGPRGASTGVTMIRAECSCGWKGNGLEVFAGDRRSIVRSMRDRAQQQAVAHARDAR